MIINIFIFNRGKTEMKKSIVALMLALIPLVGLANTYSKEKVQQQVAHQYCPDGNCPYSNGNDDEDNS